MLPLYPDHVQQLSQHLLRRKILPCYRASIGTRTSIIRVLCQEGWLLAKVREAIRMATWTRRIRRFLLNNGAASPSHPCAGKHGKTSKPPRFTNLGQEPTFLAK